MCSLSGLAWAGPADLQGILPEQQALANPVATSAPGLASVTTNPARLGIDAVQIFGALLGSDTVNVQLNDRTVGADVSSEIYGARRADGSAIPHYLATSDLSNSRGAASMATEVGLVLGFVAPMWKNRLSLAVLGYLPMRPPKQRSYYIDEREAVFSNSVHYSLYEDDRGGQLVAAAVAFRPVPWLSLGLGGQLLISAESTASVYVPDAFGQTSNQTNLEVQIRPSVVPVFGIEAKLPIHLVLSSSLRLSHATRTTGASVVQLWSDSDSPLAKMEQDLDFALDWQPLRAAVGLSWIQAPWQVSAEGVFSRWIQFRDHHNQPASPGFANTLDVGLNGSWTRADWQFLAGTRYIPSPVPAQSGRQNHADSDRLTFGIGAAKHIQWQHGKWKISFGLQASRLQHRRETKDISAANPIVDEFPEAISLDRMPISDSIGLQSNNPGWPGYTISGILWSMAMSATWYR